MSFLSIKFGITFVLPYIINYFPSTDYNLVLSKAYYHTYRIVTLLEESLGDLQ